MANLRKIFTTPIFNCAQVAITGSQAKVYRDTEWEEFRIKFFIGGKHQVEADYFASDKDEAIGSAKYWLAQQAIKAGYGQGFEEAELSEYAAALDVEVPEVADREQLIYGLLGTEFDEHAYTCGMPDGPVRPWCPSEC